MNRSLVILSFFLTSFSLLAEKPLVFDPAHLEEISLEADKISKREISVFSDEKLLEIAYKFYGDEVNVGGKISDESLLKSFKTEHLLMTTHKIFRERYGDIILDKPMWVWNNVGTVFARSLVLYCSSKEYIVLFGTQIPQEGFSGYYTGMDVWDVMLSGRMLSNGTSGNSALVHDYQLGTTSLLKKKETRFYSMDEYTYMIDYGRGNIAKAFYQGIIAPALFVNHDMQSLKTQLKQCGIETIKNMFKKKTQSDFKQSETKRANILEFMEKESN